MNLEKFENIGKLYDYYGVLLNTKQRRMIEQYYIYDYSLSEISDNEGLSRQGVFDSLKRAEKKLLEYNEKLKVIEKFEAIRKELGELKRSNDALGSEIDRITELCR